MRAQRCIMATLLLISISVGATAAPNDFARGRSIAESGDAKLQRVRLDQDVYEWVTAADLGDVRVFNAAGEEVPYQILRPQRREDFAEWVDVPVFELPTPEGPGGEGARLDIKLDDHGTVVSVDGGRTAAATAAAYLIDASALERPVSQLRFDWPSAGFVGQVRVAASTDLNTWHTIADAATLAELRTNGAEIRKDVLEFAPTASPYLRLTQLPGAAQSQAPLQISAVQARSRDSHLPPRAWKTLQPTSTDNGFEYQTGGLFPIDQVTVMLDAPTYLLEATLYSRGDADAPWQARGTHTFYATQVAGQTLASTPLPAVPHQHWRVEITEPKFPLAPLLRVGWRADEVVFLPQGPGPMQLAYGRAATEGRQWPVAELLAQMGEPDGLDAAELVSLGPATTLGGEAVRLTPTRVDWQTILLWFALLVGVALVGGLAYRLAKSPD